MRECFPGISLGYAVDESRAGVVVAGESAGESALALGLGRGAKSANACSKTRSTDAAPSRGNMARVAVVAVSRQQRLNSQSLAAGHTLTAAAAPAPLR